MTLVKLVTGRRRWPRKLSHAAAAAAATTTAHWRPAVSAQRAALLSAAEMRRTCPVEKIRKASGGTEMGLRLNLAIRLSAPSDRPCLGFILGP